MTQYGEQIARIEAKTEAILTEAQEIKGELRDLNGRVRKNSEAVVIALDRTKRIGEEIDSHVKEKDAHGGAVAKITANANVKIAILGLLAGAGGGFISRGLTILAEAIIRNGGL